MINILLPPISRTVNLMCGLERVVCVRIKRNIIGACAIALYARACEFTRNNKKIGND